MKIEGPSKAKGPGGAKKTGSAGGDGSFEDFISSIPGGSSGVSSAAPTNSIARVDSLLSVQGAESPTERAAKRRMQERGQDILKELDGLRMGLLTGTMTVGQVIDIADVVASHREKINDPRLTAILDEIDLRAQIELAKIQKALQ